MSQITIGGTTLNFKDSAFTGDQWEQVASWVLNGGAEGIDANAQIATEKAAAASASAAAARNSATSAGESATAAANSATAAKGSEDAATGSATNAAASATSAGKSASAASERAANAANSASVASSKANDAITAASDAQAAKNNAADSQTAAKQSEDNAAASATSASNSAASASSSATAAANSAASAAESIKHAPRINSNGKWELWDATKNAYVATEYTAIGEDGAKWWTYEGLVTNILGKLLISKKYLPAAVIGDYVLVTRDDAGVVYTITGETESDDSWVVKMECILKGAAGTNGITPTIGANGNWYLGTTDTGKPSRGATGEKGDTGATGAKGDPGAKGDKGDPGAAGKDGVRGRGWYQHTVAPSNPQSVAWTGLIAAPKWGEGDWLYNPDNGNVGICTRRTDNADGSGYANITYTSTLKGSDGTTPHIGANGNWYIGDTDTGVSAEGRGLPAVTAADAGKFLRVSSSGSWVAETVANANGGEF